MKSGAAPGDGDPKKPARNGSWQRIEPRQISPIEKAEVLDGDSPYTLSFDTPQDGTDALGFLVSNHLIRKAIYEEFGSLDNVTLLDQSEVARVHSDDDSATVKLVSGDQIHAQLIVAADTRFSATRRQMGISTDAHDFGRSAILCWMQHELSHQHTAFECFQYGRTLAVLPMPGNMSSIVTTLPSNRVQEILDILESRVGEAIEPAVEEAWTVAIEAKVKHADGTSWLQAGVMLSLWTIATFSPLMCGCALRSAGMPWVAQRVCAIPRGPSTVASSSSCCMAGRPISSSSSML